MGNEEVMVSVPLSMLADLLDMRGRMVAFAEYVNLQSYSVSKSECAAILGFELVKVEKEDSTNA